MWPFGPREIVVTHRLDPAQLAELVAVLRPPLAPEPPKTPPNEHELKFMRWVDEQGFSQERASHYRAAYFVVTGKRSVAPGFTRAQLLEELLEAGAPFSM